MQTNKQKNEEFIKNWEMKIQNTCIFQFFNMFTQLHTDLYKPFWSNKKQHFFFFSLKLYASLIPVL